MLLSWLPQMAAKKSNPHDSICHEPLVSNPMLLVWVGSSVTGNGKVLSSIFFYIYSPMHHTSQLPADCTGRRRVKHAVPAFHASADCSKKDPLNTNEMQEKDQGPGRDITAFILKLNPTGSVIQQG